MNKPTVDLVAHESSLFVTPPVLELQDNLKFWHVEMKVKEKEVPDGKGGVQIVKIRNGFAGQYQRLYSLTDDGIRMVTHEGLFHRVTGLLSEFGYAYTYRRSRQLPHFDFGPHVVAPMWSDTDQAFRDMRPEQVQAVIKMLATSGCAQRGRGPAKPGSGGALALMTMATGKTYTIAALIRAFPDQNIIVTTYKSAVVQRLYDGLNEALRHDGIKVGIVTGNHKDFQRVTVCTDKSLMNFSADDTTVLIFDEVHRAAADETSRTLLEFKNAVKFGFTGTLKDLGKKMLVEAVFGPVAYEFDDAQAEELNRVSKVKVYAVDVPEGPALQDKSEPMQEKYGIWRNRQRNAVIADIASRVPEHMQSIIYVRTIEHIDILVKGVKHKNDPNKDIPPILPPGYEIYHAQLPEKEKRRVEAGIYDGSIKRLVSNSAFSEGVDTTKLRVLVNADWTASDQTVSQRGGRNRRLDADKNIGIIIDLRDNWMEKVRREQVKRLEDDGHEANAMELKEDRLFGKAQTRLARYRRRGWPIVKVASPPEIDFSEIEAEAVAQQQELFPCPAEGVVP